MAFIEISNPQQREKIVQDYVSTLQEIRHKAENDKAQGLQQQIELNKQYEPLIKATKDSANKITTELKSNRSIKELDKGNWKRNFVKPAIDYYLNLKSNLDKYYGIQKKGDHYIMGSSIVDIDGDSNIYVNDQKFEGTSGLWELIMLNKPQNYTKEDVTRYEDLVESTQVIFKPLRKSPNDRPEATSKYKDLLAEFRKSYDEEQQSSSSQTQQQEELDTEKNEEGELEEEGEVEEGEGLKNIQNGKGVQYLPGNKRGLLDRLRLLYAEREAGNISSTTNEIVGILDELLRINFLTRNQYNAVCKKLSC